MFIELLDGLRCISDHPQIPLVAAIVRRQDRFVLEGVLGCPICRREYPIADGIVLFSDSGAAVAAQPDDIPPPDDDGTMRIGAFLAVADGGSVVLVGDSARYAPSLTQLLAIRAFAVNPPYPLGESERIGTLHTDRRLPFTDGSMRGVAIGEAGWTGHDVELAARVLSAGGRMIAPVDAPVPASLEELARDDAVWVAEKHGPLVSLHRR